MLVQVAFRWRHPTTPNCRKSSPREVLKEFWRSVRKDDLLVPFRNQIKNGLIGFNPNVPRLVPVTGHACSARQFSDGITPGLGSDPHPRADPLHVQNRFAEDGG